MQKCFGFLLGVIAPLFSYIAVRITGNRIFNRMERAVVTCSTPVPVQSIQWVDESNTVVRNGTSVQELDLNLMITSRSSNTSYSCIITDGGEFTETETITIKVEGNFVMS